VRERQIAWIALIGDEDRGQPRRVVDRNRLEQCTRLKMAVFAPMPRARESTAMAVNPGLLASMRRP
jgi:hypothetical protein